MDPKRIKEARAHTLAKRKPLAPPIAQFKVPLASAKPYVIVTDQQSSWSTIPLRKKSPAFKKRKASSESASPSSQGETTVDQVEQTPTRKIKRIEWTEMETIDLP